MLDNLDGGQISDPSDLPDESVISAITLADLSVGPHVAHDDAERSARQQHLQQAEADFDVLPFDGDYARAFGAFAPALRASGRKPAARVYDALIAASAIAHGLPLARCRMRWATRRVSALSVPDRRKRRR
ncbi:PIN domain-containing protein [Mycolicibacterium cosmeticum]|uniref:PIN domain-containing protein n=1 Tax=Mycolicibacterium cosmeticum TaxID=258533 RepID=UPI003204BFF3